MTTLFIPTKSEDQISHEAIKENSMTEVEKLRALLAEARRAVGDEVCIDCGIGCQSVWGRIDAAIAEPVGVAEVEWAHKKKDLPSWLRARLRDANLLVRPALPNEDRQHQFFWAFDAYQSGYAPTLEEAKEAAERAAGVRR